MNLAQLKGWDGFLGEVLVYAFAPFAYIANKLIQNLIPSKNSISILKMLGGGSLLIAYPALLAIRQKFQNSHFVLICTKDVESYALLTGLFDEICIIETKSIRGLITSALVALRVTSRSQFFINFEMHSKLCAIYAICSLSKKRFGLFQSWNKWQRNFINNPIFYNSHTPIYVGYDQLAEKIGAKPIEWSNAKYNFQVANGYSLNNEHAVRELRVAIAPFCSALYKEREFSVDEWMKVLPLHISHDCKEIVIYGGLGDVEKARALEHKLKINFPDVVTVNKVGQTKLKDVLKEFELVGKLITIDSGINHLARLVDLPVLSFWGPSDPALRLKGINESESCYYKKLSCSPCVHLIDNPPCLGNNICMRAHYEEITNLSPIWEIKSQ